MIAMSGGMVFGLYRVLASGEINTVSKGYRAASRHYSLAENPGMFIFAFVFHAAFAGAIIVVTVYLIRRVFRGTRPG